MKKADVGFSIFIIVLAACALYISSTYPMESALGPGAGFFPRAVSALLLLVGIIYLIESLVKLRKEKGEDEPFFKKGEAKNLLVFFGLFVAYIALIYIVGLVIASLIFMVLVLKLFEKYSWKKTIIASVITVAIMYGLFCFALKTDVPTGLFF